MVCVNSLSLVSHLEKDKMPPACHKAEQVAPLTAKSLIGIVASAEARCGTTFFGSPIEPITSHFGTPLDTFSCYVLR